MPKSAPKRKQIAIRLDAEEDAAYKARAAERKTDVSTYVRETVAEVERLRAEVAELRDAVAGFTEFFRSRAPRLGPR